MIAESLVMKITSQLRSGYGKFDFFPSQSSHLVVVMAVLLVFLPFHSSEKLLHTAFDFIRGALSLFVAATSLIGNPFRRRVGRHFKTVFIMLRSWRILFLRLLYLGTNVDGWFFGLCLLRLFLGFLGLHLWLFLARNATHFNNKYIESILWVTMMPELLKP